MFSVQFSADGEKFFTLIQYDDHTLAYSLMLACAGHACEHKKYWRVRKAVEGADFHAVIDE